MKCKPAFNWVLIRLNEGQETVRKSGIIVLDGTADSQFMKGTIAALGPGDWSVDTVQRIPMSFKVGDKILFTGGGLELRVDDLKYTMIRENAIAAVLEEE